MEIGNALTNFLIDLEMRTGLLQAWLNFGSPTCNLFLEDRRARISVLWRKLTWRNRNLSNHPVILFHQSVSFLLGFPKISWNFLLHTKFEVWSSLSCRTKLLTPRPTEHQTKQPIWFEVRNSAVFILGNTIFFHYTVQVWSKQGVRLQCVNTNYPVYPSCA